MKYVIQKARIAFVQVGVKQYQMSDHGQRYEQQHLHGIGATAGNTDRGIRQAEAALVVFRAKTRSCE
jgi:hypothetical protein